MIQSTNETKPTSTPEARDARRLQKRRQRILRTVAKGFAAVMLAGIAGAFGTGCTAVAPYERGKLAHPTMTAGDLSSMGEQHLRAIDEGATGGSAGTGSGCGCN